MKTPREAESGTGSDENSGSRSVRRALDILELVLKHNQPVTVAQIIAELAIPKSTAYELVRTLSDGDYLEPAGKGSGLFLGRRLYELGTAYRSHVDLLRDGSRIAEELRNETGETVQLSVLENDLMMVLFKEEGIRPLRIISTIGSRVPVNWAAAGRLLVSDMDDEALTRLLVATIRQSPTGRAVLDVQKLITQIRKFRRQGYATELNETNEHAGCVAAPVIDGSGRCVAALSIVAPEQRLARPNRDQLIAAVIAAAQKLSRRLG
ncbi:IclR family transcriptional regulator [Nordella sp. HKS 07]|uniref:IclR family transcriptional regulator n=1 Tax=Nordella sp. HKS 07 TaxID=2712222 RepID=UPI0013E14F8F|nr:IclR family transcriptional regulator [Nordella sp. HKS 07]QIG47798.1 IclR family transcriptional regulator [Nordella sp. HKS 07]